PSRCEVGRRWGGGWGVWNVVADGWSDFNPHCGNLAPLTTLADASTIVSVCGLIRASRVGHSAAIWVVYRPSLIRMQIPRPRRRKLLSPVKPVRYETFVSLETRSAGIGWVLRLESSFSRRIAWRSVDMAAC